jgi:penicillin-binding protein 1A
LKKRGIHVYLVLLVVISLCLVASGYLLFVMKDIPSVKVLKHLENKPASIVYGSNDEVVYLLVPDNRIFVSYKRIPKYVRDAFLAAEDADFFKHGAIDYTSVVRALWKNIVYGKVVQGGSTITQQVIKSLVLGPERSIFRKIREAILSYRLEHSLTKEEILNLYLNNIYMGHGVYGVEAASQIYFGKHVWEITRAEGALLAGMVQAPTRYSPKRHPGNARVRQEYVINQMAEKGFINEKRKEELLRENIRIREDNGVFGESYYKDYLLRYVEDKYGKGILSRQKLKIYAAVAGDLQRLAESSVGRGLDMYGQRKGDYVFLHNLEKKKWNAFMQGSDRDLRASGLKKGKTYTILVTEKIDEGYYVSIGKEKGILRMDTFPFKPGDVTKGTYGGSNAKNLSAFQPVKSLKVEGALLSMDVETGYVYAMVGGRDFERSPYNRAISAKLQSGSAFKPFIYVTALEKGYDIDSMLTDEPKSYGSWTPRNYDGKYEGRVSMRDAVAYSKNAAVVRLLEDIGIGPVKETLVRLGIDADLPNDLTIALGTANLTLLDLVKGFSVFANGGYQVKPLFVRRIEDNAGNVLETNEVDKRRVLPEDVAMKMNILLKGPTEYGTAKGASRLGYPVAGKTGTTSNYYDALFIGYSPHIATGVWVGFDTRTSLGRGESGGRVCLPIWMNYMASAMRRYPPDDFGIPVQLPQPLQPLQTDPSH